MRNDGRSLTQREVEDIQEKIYSGIYNDHEIDRLFQTINVQRQILRELFNLFKSEPLRRVSTADSIANSQLAYFKERVAMEDRQ